MRFCTITLLVLACIGCSRMLRPEWEPEIKPCEVWIYDASKRTAVCVPRGEALEWLRRNTQTN